MPDDTFISTLKPVNDEAMYIDDDRQTMIKVDHITMEFNKASEQLGSLKEYAIALLKRNLYFKKFTALDDISFEVKKGDVFGILGTNGSGKSTLLKIIAGVLSPTQGNCRVEGSIAPLIELGAGFDMELSARENIYLNGSLLGYSKSFINECFDDIVSFAEIEDFLDMPMKNYSSGMVARIAFAIATIVVPDILIVDEVLSVGDFMFQQKCENRISELIEKYGVTVLIVSHSNDQIERLCNKAIWIEKGHTRIMGDAVHVCNAYRILGGRKGSPNSEKMIYDAIQRCESDSRIVIPSKAIKGENHIQVSANMVLDGWDKNSCKTVVLVPDFSHSFSVLMSSIAGALEAPILPFSVTEDSGRIIDLLSKLNPNRIVLFGYSDDINNLHLMLAKQFVDKVLDRVDCKRSISGLREGMVEFAKRNNLWSSPYAFLVPFDKRSLCFAVGAASYADSIPLFLQYDTEDVLSDDILSFLRDLSIKTLYLDGDLFSGMDAGERNNHSISFQPLCNFASIYEGNNFSGFVPSANCVDSKILLADETDSQWQNLISAPSYVGHTQRIFIQKDPSDLNSIAEALVKIRQIQPSEISVIENNSITDTERKMFSCY